MNAEILLRVFLGGVQGKSRAEPIVVRHAEAVARLAALAEMSADAFPAGIDLPVQGADGDWATQRFVSLQDLLVALAPHPVHFVSILPKIGSDAVEDFVALRSVPLPPDREHSQAWWVTSRGSENRTFASLDRVAAVRLYGDWSGPLRAFALASGADVYEC